MIKNFLVLHLNKSFNEWNNSEGILSIMKKFQSTSYCNVFLFTAVILITNVAQNTVTSIDLIVDGECNLLSFCFSGLCLKFRLWIRNLCLLTFAGKRKNCHNQNVFFFHLIPYFYSGYTEIEAIEGRETFLPCMTSLTDVSSSSAGSNTVVRMTESPQYSPAPSSMTISSVTSHTVGRSKNSKNNNSNKNLSASSATTLIREEPALIIWYRGSSGIPIFTVDARNASRLSDSTQISSTEYEGRVEFDPRLIPPALRIKTIYVEDEGEYRCRCDFRKSRSQNFLLNLTVIGEFYFKKYTTSVKLFSIFYNLCLEDQRRKIDLLYCILSLYFLIHFQCQKERLTDLTKCEFPGWFWGKQSVDYFFRKRTDV